MDTIERPAAPAPAATAERHGLTFPSIGVEVQEAVFLDEADGHGLPPLQSDSPSPLDLFADERELAAPAPAPATVLLEPGRVYAPPPEPARTASDPAANGIEAPALFSGSPATTAGNVTRVMLLLLAAAATLVLTLRACA
jgi:hypothetical protein